MSQRIQNHQQTITAIYRHKVTGDYFLYIGRQWCESMRCTVLISEQQAEKTAHALGINIQVTVVPRLTDKE